MHHVQTQKRMAFYVHFEENWPRKLYAVQRYTFLYLNSSAINEVVHRFTNFFTLYVETMAYTTIKPFRQKNSNIKYKHGPAPQVLECVTT